MTNRLQLVLLLGYISVVATLYTTEWTLHTDEQGNLLANCVCNTCGAGEGEPAHCGHVEVPQLRVTATGTDAHLIIRYDTEKTEFALETPSGVGLRVGDVNVADLEHSITSCEAKVAALRDTQARMQCTLLQMDKLDNVAEAIKIATIGAEDWEHLMIGTEHFLVVANSFNGASYTQDSVVYKWSDGMLSVNQSIATSRVYDWEHFMIGTEHFLVAANALSDSVVYNWDDGTFVVNQTIATKYARDWEHFVIGNEHFLAVANYFKDGSYLQDSVVYKWEDGAFVANQSISTRGATAWEHFVIEREHFLAVANDHAAGSYLQDSVVYKWEHGRFVANQSIATIGAKDWEHFEIGVEHFLVVANAQDNTGSYLQDSVVYKWRGGAFVPHQSIATIGAFDWVHFMIGKEHFLAVANCNNVGDHSYLQDSFVYKWRGVGLNFVAYQGIATVGARGLEHFVIGAEHFLAVANNYNAGSYLQDSAVYKWNSRCFV